MGTWGDDTAWQIDNELPELPAVDFAQRRLESLAINQRLDLAATKVEIGALVGSLGITKTYRYIGSVEFGVDTENETDGQRVTVQRGSWNCRSSIEARDNCQAQGATPAGGTAA